VSAIDGWLEGILHGQVGVEVILLVSLLLGLRHASDPDHLAAVTTLIASEKQRDRVRRAGMMGFLWGLGHGTTLILVGLPMVLLNQYLPEVISKVAEVAIGCIIVLLAARLLIRWRCGFYHVHVHTHDGGEAHRHAHDESHGHTHPAPHPAVVLRRRAGARYRRFRRAHVAAALDHLGQS
jgi:ABC-type nickel/cobalt efflux system permease component RcnA